MRLSARLPTAESPRDGTHLPRNAVAVAVAPERHVLEAALHEAVRGRVAHVGVVLRDDVTPAARRLPRRPAPKLCVIISGPRT